MCEKKYVIIGIGSFASLLLQYLHTHTDNEVVAFSVNRAYMPENEEFTGYPVVALEELAEQYPPSSYGVFLGVGYSKMNTIRRNLFSTCKQLGYQIGNFIHPSAYIEPSAVLGEGNIILERCTVAAQTVMGDGNLLFSNAVIGHDDVIGSFNTFSVSASLAGVVEMGDCCFVGVGCSIFDHIHIRNYTLCGAGTVICRDTNENSVIAHAKSTVLDKNSIAIW